MIKSILKQNNKKKAVNLVVTILINAYWDEQLFKELNKLIKKINKHHFNIIPEDYEG